MRMVIRGWSGPAYLARLGAVGLAAVTWTARGLQEVLVHPDYWDPVTAGDYFAVYAYSAAFLLTTLSLLILREVARPSVALSTAILVVAVACAVTGVANGIEDALGYRGFGQIYVIGFLVSGLGMFTIAALFRSSPARRLTFVPLLGGLAMVLVTLGGGVLALFAWLGFGAILVRERQRARASSGLLPS